MADRTEAEWIKRTDAGEAFAVFLYTPLCGTCKVAARMLEVVRAAKPEWTVESANVNVLPKLAMHWRVESVPCLLHVRGGRVERKLYAFESVGNVYAFLERIYEHHQERMNDHE
ncbi:thioredoxin family protein [Paenibacillus flagellatus]|uniref:Thiol reductase thioredoxin n=1 Tax=Paenibacillus flagellatus TaxID=2211139 RepID=A0A2V5K8Y5_9BACL|nr:thioredoxin family protein [Paenibacillus flagellatus]PYI55868.1 thiol reductase thioredoxin [Paenibacillus flagellatus]